MVERVDHVRGLSIFRVAGVGQTLSVPIELCPGARVYSFTLIAGPAGAGGANPAGILHLQDAQIEVEESSTVRADLPGLAWPSHARLQINPEQTVYLAIVYGNCA